MTVPTGQELDTYCLQMAQAAKAARDRELNQQRRQTAEQKALDAQIQQIIEMNRIENEDGAIGFNFADGKKVRRIFVTEKLRDQLARGSVAIVRVDDGYALLPADAAEKVRHRAPSYVVLCSATQPSAGDADDTYADYKVPDDLMW